MGASLDFSVIKSRKEPDEQLANYVHEMPTRQFLLKNIYRVSPEQLGLRMNIEVLKNASDRVGTSLKKNITIEGEPFFLKGALRVISKLRMSF